MSANQEEQLSGGYGSHLLNQKAIIEEIDKPNKRLIVKRIGESDIFEEEIVLDCSRYNYFNDLEIGQNIIFYFASISSSEDAIEAIDFRILESEE